MRSDPRSERSEGPERVLSASVEEVEVVTEYPYKRTIQEAAEAAGFDEYRLAKGGIMVWEDSAGQERFVSTADVHAMTEER